MTAEAAPEEFVYGVVREDELVLIPLDQARDLATLWPALTGSGTWGELRSRISANDYAEILERLGEAADGEEDEEGDVEPPDDEPFDPEDIHGYNDGDWPSYPPRHMPDWLPGDLIDQYAHFEDSMLSGLYVTIDPAHTRAIIDALEQRGHRCTEDADLVRRAMGD